ATFRTTLESLISLASRATEIFERSKTEQKRQLLAFVFSNLTLRGKKLARVFNEITLRPDGRQGWLCGMAGAAGFEPANAGTKNRCLTAWRRPSGGACLAQNRPARQRRSAPAEAPCRRPRRR